MTSKNFNRTNALLPFLILFLAATVGIKSDIDLFTYFDSPDVSANPVYINPK